jgi:hypothetical protein
MEKLAFADDVIATELFTLAGAALANPGAADARRAFWKLVDRSGDHEWIHVMRRSAASAHPTGLNAGNAAIVDAIDDAEGKRYSGQPEWLKAAFQAFEPR